MDFNVFISAEKNDAPEGWNVPTLNAQIFEENP